MTTYLATGTDRYASAVTECTAAYCSPKCRSFDQRGGTARGFKPLVLQDDDSYEFDEVCANCGVLIKASKPLEPFVIGAMIFRNDGFDIPYSGDWPFEVYKG